MSGASTAYPLARKRSTSGSQHEPSCHLPWTRQNVVIAENHAPPCTARPVRRQRCQSRFIALTRIPPQPASDPLGADLAYVPAPSTAPVASHRPGDAPAAQGEELGVTPEM